MYSISIEQSTSIELYKAITVTRSPSERIQIPHVLTETIVSSDRMMSLVDSLSFEEGLFFLQRLLFDCTVINLFEFARQSNTEFLRSVKELKFARMYLLKTNLSKAK